MILKVIFLTLAAIFLAGNAFAQEQKSPPDGITEPIPVTFWELLENPVLYNKKKVKFEAFLSIKGIYNYFYPSAEFFYPGSDWPKMKEGYWYARGLMISSSFPDNLLNVNRAKVEVVATFIANDWDVNSPPYEIEEGTEIVCLDYCGDGTITTIENITVLGRPYFSNESLNETFTPYDGEYYFFEKVNDNKTERTLKSFWKVWQKWLKDKNFKDLIPWTPREECGKTSEDMEENCGGFYPEYHNSESIYQTLQSSALKKVSFFQSIPNPDLPDYKKKYAQEKTWAGCFCLKEGCEKNFPPQNSRLLSQSTQDDYLCLNFYEEQGRIVWNPMQVLYFYALPDETSE